MKRRGGKPWRIQDAQPTDEDGRMVIRMGGACPVCGSGPDIKYSGNGSTVLYHTPSTCAGHLRSWRAGHEEKRRREEHA